MGTEITGNNVDDLRFDPVLNFLKPTELQMEHAAEELAQDHSFDLIDLQIAAVRRRLANHHPHGYFLCTVVREIGREIGVSLRDVANISDLLELFLAGEINFRTISGRIFIQQPTEDI